jgi:hypothetical protein
MSAFVSNKAVFAAESVSKITTASREPEPSAFASLHKCYYHTLRTIYTYFRRVSLVMRPQNEKKSDTVFSVALGEMLDTNTAFVS